MIPKEKKEKEKLSYMKRQFFLADVFHFHSPNITQGLGLPLSLFFSLPTTEYIYFSLIEKINK